jgi:GNAT superfamily N-acetyltransferase
MKGSGFVAGTCNGAAPRLAALDPPNPMTPTDLYNIRAATGDLAEIFPAVENSAGGLFEECPQLAWIAGGDDRPVEHYRTFIAQGVSWVATAEAGRCLGFLCATIECNELHIWEMAIVRDQQRRGIGRTLVAVAKAAAAARGMSSLTLTTFREVPWNAPYYMRLGFEVIPTGSLSRRLRDLLAEEADRGLPSDMRCAMKLNVHASRLR